MSIDVEDYFHVAAFETTIDRESWSGLPCRVERNVSRILEMFSEESVRSTFFCLAWVAERFPGLIREIVAGGHELASHGCDHVPIFRQSPDEFRADAARSKAVLEEIGGVRVKGYRAPSFSIISMTRWAFDIIEDCGYTYSSSVYPIRHDYYGFPDAPRFNFVPAGTNLLECPQTTLQLAGLRLPCGGGGYFRILPYSAFAWAVRRCNRVEKQPFFFYLHPWEIDVHQPRVRNAPLKSRLRHYNNLSKTEPRLRRLLQDFSWDRFDRVFEV